MTVEAAWNYAVGMIKVDGLEPTEEFKKYIELENKGASFEELENLTLGGLRKAVVEGDVKNGSVMAGQIAGMVKEKLSCKELIDKLVSETDALIKGAGFYV